MGVGVGRCARRLQQGRGGGTREVTRRLGESSSQSTEPAEVDAKGAGLRLQRVPFPGVSRR